MGGNGVENELDAVLRAEQHGADYGVPVRVETRGIEAEALHAAVAATLLCWPSLRTVVADGRLVGLDASADRYHVDHPLVGRTSRATGGQAMFRYAVDAEPGTLDLLFHHAVADGSAVQAFLDDLAAALGDGAPAGDGLAGPAVAKIDEAVAFGPLDRARIPGPDVLAERRLTGAEWSAVVGSDATGTPFARIASAASLAFPGRPVRAGLDRRLLEARPARGGGRTALITLSDGEPVAPESVGSAIMRGAAATARTVQDGVVVSLAESPRMADGRIAAVRLGGYTEKYRAHVQVIADDEGAVVTVRAESEAGSRLDAILATLGVQPGAERPTTAHPSGFGVRSPLAEIMRADPSTPLWQLGLDSLHLVLLRDEVAAQHAVDLPMAAFYTWDTAGDAQDAIRGAGAGASVDDGTASDDAPVAMPWAIDVFIDAMRAEQPGTYEIDVHCGIADGIATGALVAAVDEALRSVPVLRRSLDFAGGAVVATSGPVVRCEVDSTAPRLSLRSPQRLAWAGIDTGSRSLHLRLHHALADATGVAALLDTIDAAVRGSVTLGQPSLARLADEFDAANAAATARWRDRLAEQPYPEPIGRGTGAPRGDHHEARASVPASEDAPSAAVVVERAVRALGRALDADRGTVGVGFAGRASVGGARAVASLARVLPVRFDRGARHLTAADLAFAGTAQDVLATNLGRLGAAFPRTLVQFVRSGAVPEVFADVRFAGGRAKFELGVDVVETDGAREVLVYGLADLYRPDELTALAEAVAEAASGAIA